MSILNVKSFGFLHGQRLRGEATVLDLKLAIQARLTVPRKEQRLAAPRPTQFRRNRKGIEKRWKRNRKGIED